MNYFSGSNSFYLANIKIGFDILQRLSIQQRDGDLVQLVLFEKRSAAGDGVFNRRLLHNLI